VLYKKATAGSAEANLRTQTAKC